MDGIQLAMVPEPDPFGTIEWPDDETCEWFALCANPAVRREPHPILGAVPICQRCSDKLDALK